MFLIKGTILRWKNTEVCKELCHNGFYMDTSAGIEHVDQINDAWRLFSIGRDEKTEKELAETLVILLMIVVYSSGKEFKSHPQYILFFISFLQGLFFLNPFTFLSQYESLEMKTAFSYNL